MKHSLSLFFRAACVLLFCCYIPALQAQDVNSAMPFANSSQLSPANTGLIEGDFGVNFSHRSRTATDIQTFTTDVLTADMPISNHYFKGGTGLLLSSDRAGGVTLNNAALGVAYEVPLGAKVRYDHIRFGAQFGVMQLSKQAGQLTFEDQFDGNLYAFTSSPSKDVVATASQSSSLALDVSIGLLYYRTQKIKGNKELNYFFGGALQHLNRPNLAFLASDKSLLTQRYTVYGGFKYRTRTFLDLNGNFAYFNQNNSQLLNWGGFVRMVFYKDNQLFGDEFLALSAGVNGRMQLNSITTNTNSKDVTKRSGIQSLAPFVGVEVLKAFSFAFAYDLNISKDAVTPSSYGGLQVVVSYLIRGKQYNNKGKALPFPKF